MKTPFLAEALLETLWPTRCACCDKPGLVLCPECRAQLEYLDQWQACPHCGAPWGRLQCHRCTSMVRTLPQPQLCISALRYQGKAATLVKTYKDQGEQRLAVDLAGMLAQALPPSWKKWAEGITFVTATKAARRRRGFDHMERLAQELADHLELPCLKLLQAPATRDQRVLSRAGRLQNTAGRFQAVDPLPAPCRVLLIDDVMTTGATLHDAQRALEEHKFEVKLASVTRV